MTCLTSLAVRFLALLLLVVCAELMQQCWASEPLSRPPFTGVMQRLEEMLSHLTQDDTEAQARFVADL